MVPIKNTKKPMDKPNLKDNLQEILESPRNKPQRELAEFMNNMNPDQFHKIVNEHLDKITAAEAKEFGINHFSELDRYPNPHDGMLDREEITECIMLAASEKDKAILLWIWLSFDEIRQSSDDFAGEERAFDIVLTLKDFQAMQA